MYTRLIRLVLFISLITSSFAALAVTPMVAAGFSHSVVLNSDGTVMTWGYNYYGQLGDGTTTSHSSPMVVPGLQMTGLAAEPAPKTMTGVDPPRRAARS